jgi:glycosyltransferase involved in cell wall biosynthesis
MRRLVFLTQALDPAEPVLAATVAKVRALARRLDEIVVICDRADLAAAPPNCRVHQFGALTVAGRSLRLVSALAAELRPRPLGVVAHMIPRYALLAAPLARPLGIPLVLWFTHWRDSRTLRAALRVSTAVASVDVRSFPVRSPKVRGIGHGIDLAEFACSGEPPTPGRPLRALVLGRYTRAKGIETILRAAALAGDVRVRCHGPLGREYDSYRSELALLADRLGVDVRLDGPVPRSEVPRLFGESHVLVNDMMPGAPDKVVYEAAAACLPALASNPSFDDLLPEELRFIHGDPESLAERLRTFDPRRRPELRAVVAERHSVDHWADGLLATVEGR